MEFYGVQFEEVEDLDHLTGTFSCSWSETVIFQGSRQPGRDWSHVPMDYKSRALPLHQVAYTTKC